ncbi:hypothetical protein [Legionella waltersii]|uniref:Uncharacterized protein n=1 Tax=Legionella waltersii TaxID=66969 RepID=A0A0W1A092_9GAMM|nr:hypothetical protein [Legionella waltersii]KTD74767.1 hypothetical protein Lwal_2808 [Legionella waltersii]SNV00342.1 Uncharacterised protein [Legionella waltersii]
MSKNKKRNFSDTAVTFLKINSEGATGIAKKGKDISNLSSSINASKTKPKATSYGSVKTPGATIPTSGTIPEAPPQGGSVINDNVKKALQRLNDNGLIKDTRVVKLVLENIGYVNRLITLFVKLRELSIEPSSDEFNLLAQNVAISGQLADLLGTMNEFKIDVHLFSLTQFVKAAESSMQFKMGLEQLHRDRSITLASLRLMMEFPANASELADLKIKLKQRGYGMKAIEKTFYLFEKDNISKVINTLIFAVDNNVYYPDMIKQLFIGKKELDSILEGAEKLANAHLLSENYFKGILNKPENANITAKMMILLKESEVVPIFGVPEIQTINRLGKAAYFLMEQLQDHNLLSPYNYALLCEDNGALLQSPVIIEAFSRLPLFERLTAAEISTILNSIENNSDTPGHRIKQIQEILDGHGFMDNPSIGSRCL